MAFSIGSTCSALDRIRSIRPVVHNITNLVAMDLSANALLAIGASPIMAHALDELDEISQISGALVINIGTLDSGWIESMTKAARLARDRKLPVILDPVGAGASKLRTDTALDILRIGGVAVLRGNASEIQSLAGAEGKTRGVDSGASSKDAVSHAASLAETYSCAVVASGEEDYIVYRGRCLAVQNGHALMTYVTAMGCTTTSLIGAFSAVEPNPLVAACSAMIAAGISGELAAEKSPAPGTFRQRFLDALYELDRETLSARAKFKELENRL